MEVSGDIIAGKKVLLVWHGECNAERMKETVEDLRSKAGQGGSVLLEHAERLIMAEHSGSSFDVVLSGVLPPPLLTHSSDLLEEFARILKPSGAVLLAELVITSEESNIPELRSLRKLPSALKFSGFVKVSECSTVAVGNMLGSDLLEMLEGACGRALGDSELQSIAVVEIHASKPSYEVGTSTQLSFANRLPATSVSKDTAKIWSLSVDDMMDDDLDLVDPDSLLAEEDLQKPDPESLRSTCGSDSQGKRKACKNCSCGLAEELAGSGTENHSKPATSSCGSCYLGDAFRCASCPYLGMPAFKPGEKIGLSNRQLKADQ